jgi:hypothetical protein
VRAFAVGEGVVDEARLEDRADHGAQRMVDSESEQEP